MVVVGVVSYLIPIQVCRTASQCWNQCLTCTSIPFTTSIPKVHHGISIPSHHLIHLFTSTAKFQQVWGCLRQNTDIVLVVYTARCYCKIIIKLSSFDQFHPSIQPKFIDLRVLSITKYNTGVKIIRWVVTIWQADDTQSGSLPKGESNECRYFMQLSLSITQSSIQWIHPYAHVINR